jgi:hypothetical protein
MLGKRDQFLNREWWRDQIETETNYYNTVTARENIYEKLDQGISLQSHAFNLLTSGFHFFICEQYIIANQVMDKVTECCRLALAANSFDEIYYQWPQKEMSAYIKNQGPKPTKIRELTAQQIEVEHFSGIASVYETLTYTQWFQESSLPLQTLYEAIHYRQKHKLVWSQINNNSAYSEDSLFRMMLLYTIAGKYELTIGTYGLYDGLQFEGEYDSRKAKRQHEVFATLRDVCESAGAPSPSKTSTFPTDQLENFYELCQFWYKMNGTFSWQEAWMWAWIRASFLYQLNDVKQIACGLRGY